MSTLTVGKPRTAEGAEGVEEALDTEREAKLRDIFGDGTA